MARILSMVAVLLLPCSFQVHCGPLAHFWPHHLGRAGKIHPQHLWHVVGLRHGWEAMLQTYTTALQIPVQMPPCVTLFMYMRRPAFMECVLPCLSLQWCFFMGLVVLASYIPNYSKPDPKYFRHAAETPYTQ